MNRGLDQLLADQQDVLDQFLDDRPGQRARFLDRDAVGERLAARGRRQPVDGLIHGGEQLGLDAVDLDLGLDRLGRDRDARDDATAADRHHDGVEIGLVLEHLEADGALAGDDLGVVVGVHEGQVLLLGDLARGQRRGVQGVADQHHPGAEFPGALDLGEGGELGHDDDGRDAQAPGMVGDPLGVIARRHGDDAVFRLLGRQALELVERAPVLERAGVLQALQLQVELAAQALAQARRGH